MIHQEKGLVPFWDDYMIDKEATTATLSVNKPTKTDVVMRFDNAWDGDGNDFFTIIKEDGFYRMYYEAWSCSDFSEGINVCYAESRDGLSWERPKLNICDFKGSTDNNIIIRRIPDNFTVMKDTNPNCPPSMRYKALLSSTEPTSVSTKNFNKERGNSLVCLVSEDGIHFNWHGAIWTGFACDTQNTLHYNEHTKKYYCYIRDYHKVDEDPTSTKNESDVRGIRVLESEDFVHWSEPKPISFLGDKEDYPLYTNCVTAYPFDTRYYVGFPTRYVERKAWSKNYDRLCGAEKRKERMAKYPRYGLAVTDCIFMSSRDNVNWYRFDEACITPGPEEPNNWVYGDCYPAVGGIIETPSRFLGEPNELSIYLNNHHQMGVPPELVRYTYRKDGFASVKSGYAPSILQTPPFSFDGESLSLNFKTSARGSVYLQILDENNELIDGYSTCELFGDSVERTVDFEKPLSELAEKTVVFRFTMQDAEIYSMRFC